LLATAHVASREQARSHRLHPSRGKPRGIGPNGNKAAAGRGRPGPRRRPGGRQSRSWRRCRGPPEEDFQCGRQARGDLGGLLFEAGLAGPFEERAQAAGLLGLGRVAALHGEQQQGARLNGDVAGDGLAVGGFRQEALEAVEDGGARPGRHGGAGLKEREQAGDVRGVAGLEHGAGGQLHDRGDGLRRAGDGDEPDEVGFAAGQAADDGVGHERLGAGAHRDGSEVLERGRRWAFAKGEGELQREGRRGIGLHGDDGLVDLRVRRRVQPFFREADGGGGDALVFVAEGGEDGVAVELLGAVQRPKRMKAGERRAVEDERAAVTGVILRRAVPLHVGAGQHEAAEATGIEGGLHRAGAITEAALKDRGDQDLRAVGGVEDLVGARGGDFDGFLDDDVLASADGRQGGLKVGAARRGDADNVKIGPGEQGGGVGGREDAVLVGQFLALGRAAGDADEAGAGELGDGLRVKAGNRAGVDDAKAEGCRGDGGGVYRSWLRGSTCIPPLSRRMTGIPCRAAACRRAASGCDARKRDGPPTSGGPT
jgi:hypothetical protein